MAYKLDETDYKILNLLQKDSRIKIKDISAQLHLSTTPIFERIKKMERAGIIERYVAVLNPEKVGKKLNAFAHISLKEHSKKAVKEFVKIITDFPVVMECHYVTGGADFIIKILVILGCTSHIDRGLVQYKSFSFNCILYTSYHA